METLIFLVIVSLFIWGVHTIFLDGYIFGYAGNWIQSHVKKWVYKILIGCPPCMSSLYGLLASIIVFGIGWQIIVLPISLCGLNYVLKSILFPEYE